MRVMVMVKASKESEAGVLPGRDLLVEMGKIQASRLRARTGPGGRAGAAPGPGPVALGPAPHPARPGGARARRGARGALGPYALQAAIAACHARALAPEQTDWPRMAALYEALSRVAPSPVVELNRAVALGMAYGPAAGLAAVEALLGEPSLRGYHLLPAVRADLLVRLGRPGEARGEFERAASLTRNARERELLLARAAGCGGDAS